MNELLWIAFMLLDLTMVLLMLRLFGRIGLFVVIAYSIILCNIQVLKTVELFGLTASLGNILYASIFLSTDILSEVHGKREAQRGVVLGLIVMVLMTLYMNFALWFVPGEADWAHGPLSEIFGLVPAVTVSSLTAYLLSQFTDVWLFHRIRQQTQGRHLWLRNNLSTLTSQLIDSAVFTGMATALGVFPTSVAFEIFLTTYLMKLVVAVVDTPFMYAARRIAKAAPES